MQELKGLKKREVFLSLKRDLAEVSFHIFTLLQLFHVLFIKTVSYVHTFFENRLCKHPSLPRNGWTMLYQNPER